MKVLIAGRHRFHVIFCAAVFLAALGLIAGFAGKSVAGAAKPARKLPIYGVNTEEKKIALTFDCAWENSDTQILLDLLRQTGAKATFFATGDWCERFPEDVKAFALAGHDVENHSYGHPHVASVSRDKLVSDTKKCDDIIENLTGIRPILYRAPYGEYSDGMMETFEKELGHRVIQWDVDSRDWQGREAEDMVKTVV